MYSVGAGRSRKISMTRYYMPQQFHSVQLPDYNNAPAPDYDMDDDDGTTTNNPGSAVNYVQSSPSYRGPAEPYDTPIQRRVAVTTKANYEPPPARPQPDYYNSYNDDQQYDDAQYYPPSHRYSMPATVEPPALDDWQQYLRQQQKPQQQRPQRSQGQPGMSQQQQQAPKQQRSSIPAQQPIRPPDRGLELIELNTDRRQSKQIAAAAASAQMPNKNRRSTTHINKKVYAEILAAEQRQAQPQRYASSMSATPASRSRAMSAYDPRPVYMKASDQQAYDEVPKHKKSEVDEYYAGIKSRDKLHKVSKAPMRGSLSSGDLSSTMSSRGSIPAVSSDFSLMALDANSIDSWVLRWSITDVGKNPGQLRSPKDICTLRETGNVVVADSKNARLQVFSGTSGKLVAILGVDSPDHRTAASFSHVSKRKMEPVGLCETSDGSLLVVTDLNRLLYIEAASKSGLLQGELAIDGKTQLAGVAVTQDSKIILTEVGTRSTVELYENNGRLIRSFKGDFRTPSHVAWNDEYKTAAVADGIQQCVSLYDASGKLLNRIGRVPVGATPGGRIVESPLTYPAGLSWLDGNRILVADRSEHTVIAIDVRNFSFEEVLTKADGLHHPVGLGTNRRNRIVLTEELYDFGGDKFAVKMFRQRDTQLGQF